MSDISIRPATRHDAADLAILDNLAGHSIPLMFWREQTQSDRLEDAIALGRERLASDEEFYNWKKSRVAVEGNMIVGMSICYMMPAPDEESEAIKQSFQAFKPVFELYDQCSDHWFIDALAVYPSAQQKGVGKRLFDDAIEQGNDSTASIMSLVVEDTNKVAFSLYRSYGFEVVEQRGFVPFEGSLVINDWLLMSRQLS